MKRSLLIFTWLVLFAGAANAAQLKLLVSAAMAEPGVLLRIEQPVDLILQRRDPIGIVLVDLPCEVDERLAIGPGFDWADREGGGIHGLG